MDLTRVLPFDKENLNVIIETPKGSRIKYAYDHKSDIMKVRHELPEGYSFPVNFGFIPGTKGDDGDPLDVLVILNGTAISGCLISCRILGALTAEQTKNGKTIRNDRILAVPAGMKAYDHIQSIDDLDKNFLDALSGFFVAYNQARDVKFTPLKSVNATKARTIIKRSLQQK
jgi:inorganic pyrophosphatase